MGESRIPKPRGGAQVATPDTRKQRYAPRPTPERSFPSGSSAGGRSSSCRPRSAKPKPKLADLEKGWVGNEVAIEDKSKDLPFDGGAFACSLACLLACLPALTKQHGPCSCKY